MKNQDKSIYLSYVLGKTMLHYLNAAALDIKHEGTEAEKKLFKQNSQDRVKLHQSYKKVFANADKYLSKQDKQKMEDAVENLMDGLWI